MSNMPLTSLLLFVIVIVIVVAVVVVADLCMPINVPGNVLDIRLHSNLWPYTVYHTQLNT